jgi:branched-chain amino acid transport system permease protein
MRKWPHLLALALAIAFPLVMLWFDELFYVSFASRILIYAIAGTSLNLILGYGGMVSFGHAAFFGAGAYTVGIAMVHGVSSAWVTWPLAVAVSAVLALIIGAICLRTRGVYFIMITLAFAQMMFYIVNGLKAYGGEEGINMPTRSTVGFDIDLKNDVVFYYVVLVCLVVTLVLLHRLVHSRFGNVIQAVRENETRMQTIGYPTYRYQLICFVIAGAVCGLAGALIANQTRFVNPNLMHWSVSGEFMIMIILGGLGYLYGGAIGALVLLLLDELISPYTLYSKLFVGLVLLVIVLFAPQGIAGLATRKTKGKPHG